MPNTKVYQELSKELYSQQVSLITVSKTKPNKDILKIYNLGQRVFGENKVQELTTKYEDLPKDIMWHMIGHLQRNKVKYIAPFVDLIHGVDSFRLLKEINKQAIKNNRIINCLLQVHIAKENTKFGFYNEEINEMLYSDSFQELRNIHISGLMGMATNTDNEKQIRAEFKGLKILFDQLKQQYFSSQKNFKELSMGMSGDYKIAIEEGSTMVRIGSTIFGNR